MTARTDAFLDKPPADGEWEVPNVMKFIQNPLVKGPLENTMVHEEDAF